MPGKVTFNDQFVLDLLRPVKAKPALVPAGPGTWMAGNRIKEAVDRCLALLDQHRGAPGSGVPTREFVEERELLTLGLHIVGHVLNLADPLPAFEHIIKTDWIAHTELAKQKRYRDHISHPLRVTGIGWWLLHRDGSRLLHSMADHYRKETEAYRSRCGIKNKGHTWRRLVEYAWLACGLLHDSIYPLEYHLRAGEGLRGRYGDGLGVLGHPLKALSDAASRAVVLAPLDGSWFMDQGLDPGERLKMLAAPAGKGLDPVREFNHAHALLGALHHLLVVGDLHSLQGLVVQLAARAICTHHDKRPDSITSDHLAFLLYVSDNLQGWRRPFLYSAQPVKSPEPVTVRQIVECDQIEFVERGTDLIARFQMSTDKADLEILKSHYEWDYEAFRKPNKSLQDLVRNHGQGLFPRFILAQQQCVRPGSFLKHMLGK